MQKGRVLNVRWAIVASVALAGDGGGLEPI